MLEDPNENNPPHTVTVTSRSTGEGEEEGDGSDIEECHMSPTRHTSPTQLSQRSIPTYTTSSTSTANTNRHKMDNYSLHATSTSPTSTSNSTLTTPQKHTNSLPHPHTPHETPLEKDSKSAVRALSHHSLGASTSRGISHDGAGGVTNTNTTTHNHNHNPCTSQTPNVHVIPNRKVVITRSISPFNEDIIHELLQVKNHDGAYVDDVNVDDERYGYGYGYRGTGKRSKDRYYGNRTRNEHEIEVNQTEREFDHYIDNSHPHDSHLLAQFLKVQMQSHEVINLIM